MRHIRYVRDGLIRVATEAAPGTFEERQSESLLDLLRDEHVPSSDSTVTALDPSHLVLGHDVVLLAPVDPPEVWSASLTYERLTSPAANAVDIYSVAYKASRPTLFLKDAMWRRTVGPDQPVGVRSDSRWNVPQPELGLVLGDRGAILGVTIGNDVASRTIESDNPLHLAQARVFAGACAIGPAVYVPKSPDETFEIHMRITDADDAILFSGMTSTERMVRSFRDLVDWLLEENPVPAGSVLLTGTGLVPPDSLTLRPGYLVRIHVPQIGTLTNRVVAASALA